MGVMIEFKVDNSGGYAHPLENFQSIMTDAGLAYVTEIEFHLQKSYESSATVKRLLKSLPVLHQLRFDRIFREKSVNIVLKDIIDAGVADKIKKLNVDYYNPVNYEETVHFGVALGKVDELIMVNSDPLSAAEFTSLRKLTVHHLKTRFPSEILFIHNAITLESLHILTLFGDEFVRFMDNIHLLWLEHLTDLSLRFARNEEVILIEYDTIFEQTREHSLEYKTVYRRRLTINNLPEFAALMRSENIYVKNEWQPINKHRIEYLIIQLDQHVDDEDLTILENVIKVHAQDLQKVSIATHRDRSLMPKMWAKIRRMVANVRNVEFSEANGPNSYDGTEQLNSKLELATIDGRRELEVTVANGQYYELVEVEVIYFDAWPPSEHIDTYATWFAGLTKVEELDVYDSSDTLLFEIAKKVVHAYETDDQTRVLEKLKILRGTIQDGQKEQLIKLFGLPALQRIVFVMRSYDLYLSVQQWRVDQWKKLVALRDGEDSFQVEFAYDPNAISQSDEMHVAIASPPTTAYEHDFTDQQNRHIETTNKHDSENKQQSTESNSVLTSIASDFFSKWF